MIRQPLILAPDVLLIPVGDLAESVRQQLLCAEGDCAITRPGSRDRSKIVGRAAARLLEEFRQPATPLEAVLRHSKAAGGDPERLLEDSFPLLQGLINCGWLVEPGSEMAAGIRACLAPGDCFAGWEVLRCVQLLEDTEIHQVRDDSGRVAALKLLRPGRGAFPRQALAREAAILRRLDGEVNPGLLACGTSGGLDFLLLEWADGVHAAAAADELRRQETPAARAGLLRLAQAVASAYVHLHRQDVLHGDVHPRNLLVAAEGSVRIVDYGLARVTEGEEPWAKAPRGGIGFFFEPELAARRLRGQGPPPTTPAGEQYSLAALLYHLFTGRHYLEFSLEKEAQLRQIVEDVPVPFTRHGLSPWPDVEACLARALRKDPGERFASVAEFAACLARAAVPAPAREEDRPAGRPSEASELERLLTRFRERLALAGPLLREGSLPAPRSSVNYGAAGIACALYRLASLEEDADLLCLADVWSAAAVKDLGRTDALSSPALDITPESVGSVSLYHGAPGVYCVQALLSHARGDVVSRDEAVSRFVSAAGAPCRHLDLTLGRAGTLLGCALLWEAMPGAAALREFGDQARDGLWDQVRDFAPVAEGKRMKYLGVAHGWAGILYAFLRWSAATGTALPGGADERLGQLAACAEPDGSGRGLRWPRRAPAGGRPREADYLPGWCHGSAGFVFLWALAHRLLREERCRTLAEGAAHNAREDPDRVVNLCCGLAGRSYALLHWYKHTGEQDWLAAARRLALAAATRQEATDFPDHSLYKGRLGIALLAADLNHSEGACLPLFEGEGWPSPDSAPEPAAG